MKQVSYAFGLILFCLPHCVWGDYNQSQRKEMVRVIKEHSRGAQSFFEKGKINSRVLTSMSKIPRHRFVSKDLAPYAYEDRPLPIGFGQTISQPYIVALMTDLLRLDPEDRVLEIGTGSGYQAAVLGALAKEVFTIEIIPPLGKAAKKKFEKLGYKNIKTKVADGYHGWKEKAPFDAIIVTAAAGHVPPPLIKQLKEGGRMIIPVGGPFSVQQLMIIEKLKNNKMRTTLVLPVRFVPFTGNLGQ
jgi:protein-L-isoaspartate(D-aspartate) O-methyltransferase